MDYTFPSAFTSAAGALEAITTGCESSYIRVTNVTTNIVYEYYSDGTTSMGTSTAGATGIVTQADSSIVVNVRGFSVAAATLSTSDVVHCIAFRL